MSSVEDSEIVSLMKKDDTKGLEAAVEKYRSAVELIAAGMLSEPADREEAVSDTFFKLWRSRGLIDTGRSSLKTYISIIARSCSADRLRSIRRLHRQEAIPLEENDIGVDVDYDSAVARKHNQDLIAGFVCSMPSPDREVFTDRYYFNMPIKDISARYGLREKQTEYILAKARKKLREALEKGGVLL